MLQLSYSGTDVSMSYPTLIHEHIYITGRIFIAINTKNWVENYISLFSICYEQIEKCHPTMMRRRNTLGLGGLRGLRGLRGIRGIRSVHDLRGVHVSSTKLLTNRTGLRRIRLKRLSILLIPLIMLLIPLIMLSMEIMMFR